MLLWPCFLWEARFILRGKRHPLRAEAPSLFNNPDNTARTEAHLVGIQPGTHTQGGRVGAVHTYLHTQGGIYQGGVHLPIYTRV